MPRLGEFLGRGLFVLSGTAIGGRLCLGERVKCHCVLGSVWVDGPIVIGPRRVENQSSSSTS